MFNFSTNVKNWPSPASNVTMLQSRKKAENENVLKSDTMLKIRIENEEKCVEFLTEAEKTGQRKRAE